MIKRKYDGMIFVVLSSHLGNFKYLNVRAVLIPISHLEVQCT